MSPSGNLASDEEDRIQRTLACHTSIRYRYRRGQYFCQAMDLAVLSISRGDDFSRMATARDNSSRNKMRARYGFLGSALASTKPSDSPARIIRRAIQNNKTAKFLTCQISELVLVSGKLRFSHDAFSLIESRLVRAAIVCSALFRLALL